MQRVKIGQAELEYGLHGSGEPVLLIHGAHIADALRLLVAEPALDGFQMIEYHRRGYAGSTRPPGLTSTEDHAGDAVGLLDHLGVGRAHLVGHSYGAMIALSLAPRTRRGSGRCAPRATAAHRARPGSLHRRDGTFDRTLRRG